MTAQMMAQTLDGALVAQQLKGRVAARVAELAAAGIRPGLAAVIVGDNPASKVYVGSKVRTCGELGLHSERYELPETTTTEELLRLVERLNRSDEIDGILVQLPLPGQIDAQRVLEAVDPAKDVDGFHPVNVGRLVQGRAELVACTPSGVIELLDHYAVPLAGARVVVVGRSDIVGKPLALLLLHRHATVTVCHSRTRDLPAVTREAEILIAAIGRAAMITGEYVGEGAVVVDIGMNKATSPGEVERIFGDAEQELRLGDLERRGYTLVGDVEPRSVTRRAAALTPVPGGVGPLTIACLMRNTVRAAEMRRGGEGERGIDISSVNRSSPSRS